MTAGRLALLFALAPCILPFIGVLLAPLRHTVFADAGARYALVGFMTGCSVVGISSPFLAFRAIMHRRRGEEHASVGEATLGTISLVIFTLCLLSPFPMFIAGRMFMYVTAPKDHRYERSLPEERNLRSIYAPMRDAAEKHPEKLLPRLSAVPGRLMHEFTDVYKPGWGESPSPYIASRDPKYRRYEEGMDFKATVDDGSFFYLGYEVANDAEMAVFAAAYRAAAASGRGFDRDFESTPENGGAGAFRLHRLNLRPPAPPAELKRPPLPKILGQGVPVLIERIRNNKGKGGHVLYLDGHVEFIDYPGRWPMTPKTVALLDELDRMGDDGHAAR